MYLEKELALIILVIDTLDIQRRFVHRKGSCQKGVLVLIFVAILSACTEKRKLFQSPALQYLLYQQMLRYENAIVLSLLSLLFIFCKVHSTKNCYTLWWKQILH